MVTSKELFDIFPRLWSKPLNESDCYFCTVIAMKFNQIKLTCYEYPNFVSSLKPIKFVSKNTYFSQENESIYFAESYATTEAKQIKFNDHELNELVDELGLPKIKSKFLSNTLKKGKLTDENVNSKSHRMRNIKFPTG
ncbi:hypothetical protein A3Q56_06636 [Intoshia linei]|uniref:Uncharacterized protein n=1 Tax=Intoshia linei TaxID=1819745 RepID=A0A177AVV4_9BILA|nr:hypothetical protein A3Q56_06636 [Intoshia linei]